LTKLLPTGYFTIILQNQHRERKKKTKKFISSVFVPEEKWLERLISFKKVCK
jgi:hypothetical protein